MAQRLQGLVEIVEGERAVEMSKKKAKEVDVDQWLKRHKALFRTNITQHLAGVGQELFAVQAGKGHWTFAWLVPPRKLFSSVSRERAIKAIYTRGFQAIGPCPETGLTRVEPNGDCDWLNPVQAHAHIAFLTRAFWVNPATGVLTAYSPEVKAVLDKEYVNTLKEKNTKQVEPDVLLIGGGLRVGRATKTRPARRAGSPEPEEYKASAEGKLHYNMDVERSDDGRARVNLHVDARYDVEPRDAPADVMAAMALAALANSARRMAEARVDEIRDEVHEVNMFPVVRT